MMGIAIVYTIAFMAAEPTRFPIFQRTSGGTVPPRSCAWMAPFSPFSGGCPYGPFPWSSYVGWNNFNSLRDGGLEWLEVNH